MCRPKEGYQSFFGESCYKCSQYGFYCDNVGLLGGILQKVAFVEHPGGMLFGIVPKSKDEQFVGFTRFDNGINIGRDFPIQKCPVLTGESQQLDVVNEIWDIYSGITNLPIPKDVKGKLNL